MKVVRFTQRSFVQNRIVEPGETILLPDDHPMSLHMIDVAKESEAAESGDSYEPEGIERHSVSAVFRADLASDIVASGYMAGRTYSGQVAPEKDTVFDHTIGGPGDPLPRETVAEPVTVPPAPVEPSVPEAAVGDKSTDPAAGTPVEPETPADPAATIA